MRESCSLYAHNAVQHCNLDHNMKLQVVIAWYTISSDGVIHFVISAFNLKKCGIEMLQISYFVYINRH